uniref:Putative RNA-dependent RNA polymerase n=1 Tax=Newfield virus TaxID=1654354 RepID=A0A2Z4QKS2_9VIRU|nr:putative RNA-dependent RNA polymerase [Newfield virus]
MDASNPTNSSERFTLEELRYEHVKRKRQDLAALHTMAKASTRTYVGGALPDRDNIMEVFKQLDAATQAVDPTPMSDFSYLNSHPAVPVDNTKYQGIQIHPASKNQQKGYVSSNRMFGRVQKYDSLLTVGASVAFSRDELLDSYRKYTYCYGTAKGFEKRLKMLTTRKCKRPYTPKVVAGKLMRLMPCGSLPDWHDFEDLLSQVKTTAGASAGAPYFKEKRKAYNECMDVIFPQVCAAIEKGELSALLRGRPEWMLVEIKNKLDRYETAKLEDKTRPYGAMPMHFSLLFSALLQPVCDSLKKWTSYDTPNAYGMSFCNGELMTWYNRIEEKRSEAISTKQNTYMLGCYGDDGEIILCKKDGTVWAVDPDFKQMDGSVDRATVRGVCKWIYNLYTEQHGESPFWANVLDLLEEMATDPLMIISGMQTYTKKQTDGIISGVVGTTIFDTAKAVIAYHDLLNEFEFDPSLFNDAKRVASYLYEKHGLVVKEGTWSPHQINMDDKTTGSLFRATKFLGMKLMWMNHADSDEPFLVPYLPDEDWLDLMMSPRDNIEYNRADSELAKNRRSFDRARGLLITGGMFSERTRQALFSAIDSVPDVAVLMEVSANGGTGSVETSNDILLGDNFQYPNSDGIPTWDWTCALYSMTREERDEKYKFTPVYPELVEFISDRKQTWKERWRYMIKTRNSNTEGETNEGTIMSGIFSGKQVVREEVPDLTLPTVSTSFAQKENAPQATNAFKKDEQSVEVTVAKRQVLQPIKEAVVKTMELDPTDLLAKTSFIPLSDIDKYDKNYEWVLENKLFYPRDTVKSHPNQFIRAFGADNNLRYSLETYVLDQKEDLKQVSLSFINELERKDYRYATLICRKVPVKKMVEAANLDFQTYLTSMLERKKIGLPGDAKVKGGVSWSASVETAEVESDTTSLSTVSTSMAARITRDIISNEFQQLRKELSLYITSEIQKAIENGKIKASSKNGSGSSSKKEKAGKSRNRLRGTDVGTGKKRPDSGD